MLERWTRQRAALAAILLFPLSVMGVLAAPAHPHLFYAASDVPALKARMTDPFYQDLYNHILSNCRSSFGPGATIPNPSRINNARAIVSHGALLLLDPTGRAIDARYQSNVLFFSYFNAVLNWSEWGDFFDANPLEPSFLLIGLCIGYDMHYDKFTASQRTDIVNKLAARADYIANNTGGFFEDPDELSGSSAYLYTFRFLRNRSVIPIGALGMIAIALEGEVDETRRQKWISKVEEILGLWDDYVAHDGMSHEGYAYHEYLMRSLLPMLYAWARRTGETPFTDLQYIRNYPISSIYSWVPGGDRGFVQPMPFGDCETGPPAPMPTHAALIARMLKGDANRYDRLANWMGYKGVGQYGNNSYARIEATQFFWADSSVGMASPEELALPCFHYFPERGVFVWRSGWDNMATYFAMTCGATIGGHQHPEMGNFVIHKGGSPFIGHHGYSKSRRTEDHNVMMVGGSGQYGDRYEDGDGTTEPQPSSKWASIGRVVADDDYFDVVANLKPIYRKSLSSYTREYMQTDGIIFVLDKIKMSGGSGQFQSILNAYSTTHPELGYDYDVLDIDSNPTANPWGGSGRTHTITPRSAGPFTGSMTVQDLSKSTWTPTVAQSIVNNADNQFVQRGYRLSLTQTASNGNLLVAFYFPASGRSVTAWPDTSVGNGFMIKSGSAVTALGLWSDSGSVSNSSGLTLTGQMGGLDLVAGSIWGRELTKLQYNGRTFLTSTKAVSFYCARTSAGSRMRLQSDSSATVSVYHPLKPLKVILNGATLAASAWSWSDGMLNLTLSAQGSQALIETTVAAKNGVGSRWTRYR